MLRLVVNHRTDHRDNKPVESYSRSYVHYLNEAEHDVVELGEGCEFSNLEKFPFRKFDYLIDIDSGRNAKGNQCFIGDIVKDIKKVAVFIDSHGNPSLHKRLASHYDHVFFAVWSQRDLFANHPSAHFCPNATDTRWFVPAQWDESMMFDFGFFGSKGGLNRADPLKTICESKGWTYDIRQINGPYKHKWPHTSLAMSQCKFLFNHGQKHDINLRIFESMAVGRPLICDMDPQSGIDKLFKPGEHFIPYQSYTYHGLEEAMQWAITHKASTEAMAQAAYQLVTTKHTIKNRVEQILGVING